MNGRERKIDYLLFCLRYDTEPPDLPEGVDGTTLSEDRARSERYIPENQAKLAALTARNGCMTTELYNMAPSDQVVSNAQKRKYNADAFHRNVQTVDTVVQDVSILQSFLIAKKAIEYNQPQELDVSSMSAQLDSVSSGKYYKVTEADGSTPKMAKLSEKARNSTDNMESEDVWSSNFSAQWNAMLLSPEIGRFEQVNEQGKPPLCIEGYAVERLPRHENAREKQPMLQEHDVYSFWLCWLAVMWPRHSGETVSLHCCNG